MTECFDCEDYPVPLMIRVSDGVFIALCKDCFEKRKSGDPAK